MALVCSGCRQPLISDARFCPNCGTPVREPPAPLAATVATFPICGNCGIFAPLEHGYCSICDATLGPQRLFAPSMPAGLVWTSISVRFECRACRQLAPLNHLDIDGLVKCMHCGVEQRFDVARWQGVIGQAHQVADSAVQRAAASSSAGAFGQNRPLAGGGDAAFVTAKIDSLEVRVGVGHPLCEKCSSPLVLAGQGLEPLAAVCPKCNSQRTYVLPSGARQQLPTLRGVVCAEHELGRRDVQTEIGAGGSVAIRCGNCSAPLPISDGKSVIHCPFCGVACRITPDTLWRLGNRSLRADWWWLLLERPSNVAQGNQPEWENAVYARLEARPRGDRSQRANSTSSGSGCAFAVVFLGLAVGIGLASYFALRKSDGSSADSIGNASNPLSAIIGSDGRWNSLRAPVVSDVNRDGIFDLIGEIRKVSPDDTVRVAAFDGSTGKRLWQSEIVGSFSEAGSAKLQIAFDTVLLPLEGGRLRAFKLSDGSSKFNLKLHENIERFCSSTESGFVLVETKDKQQHQLALSNGSIQATQAAGRCSRLQQALPELVDSEASLPDAPTVRDLIDGMSSSKTVRFPDSDLMLALGEKKPGTRIAKVAAFRWPRALDDIRQMQELQGQLAEASPKQKSELSSRISNLRMLQITGRFPDQPQVLWVTDVPGVDPLTTTEGSVDTDDVDVHGDTLAIIYGLKSAAHRYRLTAFSLRTGQRLWDTDIDDSSPYSGIRATPHHVFVSRWNGLYAFAIGTGRLVYKIP